MWAIAIKNFKSIGKNIFLLMFLLITPLLMIYLIKMMENNVSVVDSNGYVEMVILSVGGNGYLTQTFTAGLLVQFLLIAGIMAAAMVVEEREQNTLIRIMAAPVSKLKVLVGIFIGHALTTLTVSAALIGLTYSIFDITWGSSWFNLFIVTLFAVYVAASMAFCVSGLFKSPKVTGAVMSAVIIAMTFMSGYFIQGPQFDTLSKFTINKWITDAYIQLMKGNGLREIVGEISILGVMGTVFMLFAVKLYRRENIYE